MSQQEAIAAAGEHYISSHANTVNELSRLCKNSSSGKHAWIDTRWKSVAGEKRYDSNWNSSKIKKERERMWWIKVGTNKITLAQR